MNRGQVLRAQCIFYVSRIFSLCSRGISDKYMFSSGSDATAATAPLSGGGIITSRKRSGSISLSEEEIPASGAVTAAVTGERERQLREAALASEKARKAAHLQAEVMARQQAALEREQEASRQAVEEKQKREALEQIQRRETEKRRRLAKEEAERKAAAEREHQRRRDEQLALLEKEFKLVVARRCLQRSVDLWKQRAEQMIARTRWIEMKVVFQIWQRAMTRVQEQRAKLDRDLSSVDPAPVTLGSGNMSSKLTVSAVRLARRRAQKASTFDSTGMVFGGSRNVSLQAAASVLTRLDSGECIARAVAPSLFLTQTNSMRRLLNVTELTSTAEVMRDGGALWSQDLFLKVSIFTPAASIGVWDQECLILPNLLRSVLLSPSQPNAVTPSPEQLLLWSGPVVCAANSHRRITRHVHIAVMDGCCGANGHGVLPRTPVLTSLAAIVVIPDVFVMSFEDDTALGDVNRSLMSQMMDGDESAGRNCRDTAMRYLQDMVASCVPLVHDERPIVLVVTKESVLPQSSHRDGMDSNMSSFAKWAEIQPDASSTTPGVEMVTLFVQLLADAVGRSVYIDKAFLLEAYLCDYDLPKQEPPSLHLPPFFGDVPGSCRDCIASALKAIALAVEPLPLMQRIGVCGWIEEAMIEDLWSDDMPASSCPESQVVQSTLSNSYDSEFEGYMSDTEPGESSSGSRRVVVSGKRIKRRMSTEDSPGVDVGRALSAYVQRLQGRISRYEERVSEVMRSASSTGTAHRKRSRGAERSSLINRYLRYPVGEFATSGAFVPGAVYDNSSDVYNSHAGALNALDSKWGSVSRLKDSIAVLAKFRLPTWDTATSADVRRQCELFVEELESEGWNVPPKNRLLSIKLPLAESGGVPNTCSSSRTKRRRSEGGPLIAGHEGVDTSAGRDHWQFITLFRRWLTMAIQRRARDVSALHMEGEEVFLPILVQPQPPTVSDAVQVAEETTRVVSAHHGDVGQSRGDGSPVTRAWKESVIELLPPVIDTTEPDHHKEKYEPHDMNSDDDMVSEEEGSGHAFSEGDDASDYFHWPAEAQSLREQCCYEMQKCLELERVLRRDLSRGKFASEETWDYMAMHQPCDYDYALRSVDDDMSILPVDRQLRDEVDRTFDIKAADALKYVQECQQERIRLDEDI